MCENFSLEKQSTFRIAAYFYVYSKQVGFNRAPLNPTCCEISAEPNFRYTTILSRVLSTSVLNQLVFAFSAAEANFRYTTIPCTCNLVAAYIIPSVFHHFHFFSPGSPSEVHNDTLQHQFSRCLYNSLCFFNFFKHFLPEANLRYTTILCKCSLVAAYIIPIICLQLRRGDFRYTTKLEKKH